MAVSKRLRFEVLRRDAHTCRYCGRAAPEVKLTVDHVVPQALGGPDTPDNLVTACADCNDGKTSIAPDSPLVTDVADDAARWATAMKVAAQRLAAEDEQAREYVSAFREDAAGYGILADLPDGWENSVNAIRTAGLPLDELLLALAIAVSTSGVTWRNKFRYTCGVAYKRINRMHDEAHRVLAGE